MEVPENRFFPTRSGGRLNLLRPDPALIELDDIAWSLSCMVRFNGHTRVPITVAEHSLRLAQIVAMVLKSWNLQQKLYWRAVALAALHDAHEAYTGEFPKPFLMALNISSRNDIEYLKEVIDKAIFRSLKLTMPNDPETKHVMLLDSSLGHAEVLALHTPGSIIALANMFGTESTIDLIPTEIYWDIQQRKAPVVFDRVYPTNLSYYNIEMLASLFTTTVRRLLEFCA